MSEQTSNILDQLPVSREAAKIKKLLIVEIPVADMQRAIEFYIGQLGFYLDVKKNPLPIKPENREVFISPSEGIKIMLWQTEGSERLRFTRDGKPHHFVILEIDEPAETMRDKLMASGMKVGEISGVPADQGGCGRAFSVWDPDGNLIRLCYRPS